MIALVKRARAGDDAAFLELFRQYEADLYRMAYVYVKNEADALDVMQEAAYLSFKQLHTLQKPEYFKTWLTRITINCAMSLLQKQKRTAPLPQAQAEQLADDEEDVPLTLTLQQLLEELRAEEKSAVLLRFYAGYTFPEIADMLTVPLGTAKSLVYSALRKLRIAYEKEEM